jgi:hypothetical protein
VRVSEPTKIADTEPTTLFLEDLENEMNAIRRGERTNERIDINSEHSELRLLDFEGQATEEGITKLKGLDPSNSGINYLLTTDNKATPEGKLALQAWEIISRKSPRTEKHNPDPPPKSIVKDPNRPGEKRPTLTPSQPLQPRAKSRRHAGPDTIATIPPSRPSISKPGSMARRWRRR